MEGAGRGEASDDPGIDDRGDPPPVLRRDPGPGGGQIDLLVQADAADGFILVPHVTPGGLDRFADEVVPILQDRGRFRTKYTGETLRDHLDLPLLRQPGAEAAGYSDLLDDVVGLLRGTYRSPDGIDPRPVPGQGAGVQVWVLGSSAGESAMAAGRLGLRFAANYHVSPATVLEAADGHRWAFVPSVELDRPYVAVSADVVVGPDDDAAEELAAGFALWVRSIRCGEGAIEFPTADEAAPHRWTEQERALVADRVDTQFVMGPEKVVAGLERLVEATGADELVVTTITHDHVDRIGPMSCWPRSGALSRPTIMLRRGRR